MEHGARPDQARGGGGGHVVEAEHGGDGAVQRRRQPWIGGVGIDRLAAGIAPAAQRDRERLGRLRGVARHAYREPVRSERSGPQSLGAEVRLDGRDARGRGAEAGGELGHAQVMVVLRGAGRGHGGGERGEAAGITWRELDVERQRGRRGQAAERCAAGAQLRDAADGEARGRRRNRRPGAKREHERRGGGQREGDAAVAASGVGHRRPCGDGPAA